MNEVIKELFISDFVKIAVCGIMKNEELHITRYLKDFSGFDKIFLLDTGSTDATVSLTYGKARTFTKWFDAVDYSEFRNSLLEIIKDEKDEFDFILWADIDETPDLESCSIAQLKEFLGNQQKSSQLFEFSRTDISSSPPIRMIRIFRTDCQGKWEFPIHEQFVLADRGAHPPVLTPLTATHLESERIQLLDKALRYEEMITRNFMSAVIENDTSKIYHYLFFYVDIVSQKCDSAELVRLFELYVKSGKQFEFEAWYLRKFLSYFACMKRADLVEEAYAVIQEFYPQHLPYANGVKLLVEDVIANGAPFQAVVDKSAFKKVEMESYPIRLVISATGSNAQSAVIEMKQFFDKLSSFYTNNMPPAGSSFDSLPGEIVLTFSFDSSFDYYQLHGSKECSSIFIELMLIVIKHGLLKRVAVQR